MDDSQAYHLDINGLEETAPQDERRGDSCKRPWVGIRFDCCGVYTRVYRSSDETAYCGSCPRCLKKVRLRVGPGGVDARFFTAE